MPTTSSTSGTPRTISILPPASTRSRLRCLRSTPPTMSAIRRTALALPGAVEGAHQGHADFRVGKRIFATLGYPDDAWGMVKLTPEQQSVLVEAEPDIFRRVPGGWGKYGNTNVRLAKADATTLRSALTLAWTNIAPKLLLATRKK